MQIGEALLIVTSKQTHAKAADFLFASDIVKRQAGHAKARFNDLQLPLAKALYTFKNYDVKACGQLAQIIFSKLALADKSLSNSERKRLHRLCLWLLENNSLCWFTALQRVLRLPGDEAITKEKKREILACIFVLDEFTTSLREQEETFKSSSLLLLMKDIFPELIRVNAYKSQNLCRSGKPVSTKLHIFASNLCIRVLEITCSAVLETSNSHLTQPLLEELWRNLPSLESLIKDQHYWHYQSRNDLLVIALKDLALAFHELRNSTHDQNACARIMAANILASADGLINDAVCIKAKEGALVELFRCIEEIKESISQDETCVAQDVALIHLRRFCLLLGRVHYLPFQEEVVIDVLVKTFELLIIFTRFDSERVSQLIVAAIRAEIRTLLASDAEMNAETIFLPLTGLLTADDLIADVAATLIAEGASVRPTFVLPELFGLLSSSRTHERRNAVRVLERIFMIISDKDIQQSMSSTWANCIISKELEEKVIEQLVDRLDDDSLEIRKAASSAFSVCNPGIVIPSLLNTITCPDRTKHSLKKRSAAIEAIQQCVLNDRDLISKACYVLDFISREKVENEEGESARMDRLIKLFPKWINKISGGHRRDFLNLLLAQFFSNNRNQSLVALLKQLEEYLSDNMEWLLSEIIIPRIQLQGVLKAEMITVDEEDESVKSLLFDRIAPLLVLRVLREEAFQGDNCEVSQINQLSILLNDRIFNNLEFKQVQQLCCEILAKLNKSHYGWPVVDKILEAFLEGSTFSIERSCPNYVNSNMITAKIGLYICCNLVSTDGFAANPLIPHTILHKILRILNKRCTPSNLELYKLQQGCIQCISLLIIQSVRSLSSSTVNGIITEIEGSENCATELDSAYVCTNSILLDCININEGVLSDALKTDEAKICIINAVTLAFKTLNPDDMYKVLHHNNSIMLQLCSIARKAKHPGLRCASLQAAFTGLYSAENHRRKDNNNASNEATIPRDKVHSINQYCMDLLNEKDDEVREGALKMLAVVLAIEGQDIVLSSYSNTISKIKTIANMDSNARCRDLAEKIVKHTPI